MPTLARWQRTIVDGEGRPIPYALVEVRREIAGLPLIPLYSDRAGSSPLSNPFQADANGLAAFHVAGVAYKVTVTKDSFSQSWCYVGIGRASESDVMLSLVPRGVYSNAEAYIPGDLVSNGGALWVCLAEAFDQSPPALPTESNAYWSLFIRAVEDHGALTGRDDDDHTQYHNDARGDARYYTKTQIDAAGYATQSWVTAALNVIKGGVSSAYDTLAEIVTALGFLAPKDSPDFTGTPLAPHPSPGDDSRQLATTGWVLDNAGGGGGGSNLVSKAVNDDWFRDGETSYWVWGGPLGVVTRTTASFATGYLWLLPFHPGKARTLANFAVSCTAVPGAPVHARTGVYEMRANGLPGLKICEVSASSNITTTGFQYLGGTLTGSLDLENKHYYLALSLSSTITLSAISSMLTDMGFFEANGSPIGGLRRTHTHGTLPADLTSELTSTYEYLAAGSVPYPPVIYWR